MVANGMVSKNDILVWCSQKPTLMVLSKVIKRLSGNSPIEYETRGQFLDDLSKYSSCEQKPVLIILGDEESNSLQKLKWIFENSVAVIMAISGFALSIQIKERLKPYLNLNLSIVNLYEIVSEIDRVLKGLNSDEIDTWDKNKNRKGSDMSYEKAEKAAKEILVMEKLKAKNGEWPSIQIVTKEAEDNPPFLDMDLLKLRGRLWHAWKRLLTSAQKSENCLNLVSYAYDNLAYWEKIETGRPHQSLNQIFNLVIEGKLDDAATLAKKMYSLNGEEDSKILNDKDVSISVIREQENQPVIQKRADYQHLKQFEILLVDDNEDYINRIYTTFNRLAKSCKDYKIKISTVYPENAYEDALYKINKNPLIQAVVMDWDLTSGIKNNGTNGETGVDLILKLKKEKPWLHFCLLTGRGVLDVLREYTDFDVRPFDKGDQTALEEIFADILQSIKKREATPFFTALEEYSDRPVTVFHALAISRGKAIRKSTWLGDFFDFYGDRIFNAESSSTLAPLDSLFSPKSSLARAQELASRVFGADRTFFITNGTSTANKIVHQALLKPDDIVLIDRNCHKSHHYGLVLVGARPVYLKTEPLSYEGQFTGICKGVTLDEVLKKIERHPSAKMLCLTNCTFDGYVHDPDEIIKAVHHKLQDLKNNNQNNEENITDPDDFIFFFDEAWFGFARFIPELRPYTAMASSINIPKARVYATQSTHKTLFAFRQGSMIHVRDPKFVDNEHDFEEAFYTHFTTSPSYNLIASLDVGRMAADLDGPRLCTESWNVAIEIRHFMKKEKMIEEYFHLLTPEEMGCCLPETEDEKKSNSFNFIMDQTKLTFFLKDKTGMTGDILQGKLLNEFDIQVNKTTKNTILFMVNAGSTSSSTGHLVTTLRRIVAQLKRQIPPSRTEELSPVSFKKSIAFYGKDNAIRDYFFGKVPGNFESKKVTLDGALDMIKNKMGPLINSTFIIPYPPGFPLLVPGQLIDRAAIKYLKAIKNNEIHGMPSPNDLKVWVEKKIKT